MKTIQFLVISMVCALCVACDGSDSSSSDGTGAGQGGSMARFTITGDYMYTVDNHTLKLFDLANPDQPEYLERKEQTLGFGVETIFSKDTLLFIGSQDGMYIYSVVRPEFPQLLSHVSHISSCDPVVATDKYAYVTLNTQSIRCGNNNNVLQIYDISDLRKPVLKVTENMNYPKGLGVDGNKLFVCDANLGIKVFDVTNPLTPVWIDDLTRIPEANGAETYDVIPVDGILLTSTSKGLYQFSYTGEKLAFLSKITITQ